MVAEVKAPLTFLRVNMACPSQCILASLPRSAAGSVWS